MSLERRMRRMHEPKRGTKEWELKFRARFDALLISLDPKEALALYNEHMAAEHGPPKNDAHIAALHKARIARPDIINEAGRELSRVWLVTHGFNVDIAAPSAPLNLNNIPIIRKH